MFLLVPQQLLCKNTSQTSPQHTALAGEGSISPGSEGRRALTDRTKFKTSLGKGVSLWLGLAELSAPGG